MKQTFPLTLGILIFILGIAACSSNTTGGEPSAAALDPLALKGDIDAQTAAALQHRADVMLLDVREPSEYAEGHIPGITHIPMNDVANRLQDIPKDKTVIVTCRSGNRSSQIVSFLQQQGYTHVHNMRGGIIAWQQAGYPVEK